MSDTFDPQAIQTESVYLRRLARTLVESPEDADDLVQQTWLRAFEHPPRDPKAARSFLAQILKRWASNDRRHRTRRRERERLSSLLADNVSEHRHETHHTVAEAVQELAPKYRTVITLRYYQGLQPRHIAESLDLPLATVETRLRRARKRLRSILDRKLDGDRRSWTLLFAPWLGPTDSPIVGTHWKSTLHLSSIVLGLPITLMVVGTFLGPKFVETDEASHRTHSPLQVSDPDSVDFIARTRTALETSDSQASGAASLPLANRKRRTLDARLIDATGKPWAHQRLTLREEEGTSSLEGTIVGVTDENGYCRFHTHAMRGRLSSAEGNVLTLRPARLREEPPTSTLTIIAAKGQPASFRIEDASGHPLEGVHLSLALPDGFHRRFGDLISTSISVVPHEVTDAFGRATFDSLPLLPGSTLRIRSHGREPLDLSAAQLAAQLDDEEMTLVLHRAPCARWVRGRVVDASDTPLQGVSVRLRNQREETDERGEFAIAWSAESATLWVLRPGHLPVCHELTSPPESRLTFRVSDPSESICGVVLDQDGTPIRDVDVVLPEATLIHGEEVLENVLRGRPDRFVVSTRTDERGRFRLDGLLDKTYRLAAIDPHSLHRSLSAPISAGRRDVVLRIDRTTFGEVRGRLVDPHGRGLEGVSITPTLTLCEAANNEARLLQTATLPGTLSGAGGEFILQDLPRSSIDLRLVSANIEERVPLHSCFTPGGQALIVVEPRLSRQLRLLPSTTADRFVFVDEAGSPLDLLHRDGQGVWNSSDGSFRGGASLPLLVPPNAHDVILFFRGRELFRKTLERGSATFRVLRL